MYRAGLDFNHQIDYIMKRECYILELNTIVWICSLPLKQIASLLTRAEQKVKKVKFTFKSILTYPSVKSCIIC